MLPDDRNGAKYTFERDLCVSDCDFEITNDLFDAILDQAMIAVTGSATPEHISEEWSETEQDRVDRYLAANLKSSILSQGC